VVAQPDQNRGNRADQRYGALAKDAVRIVLLLLAELARQKLADRVGIAGRECVEGVAVLEPGRDHEVQHPDVVLAAEAPGEREHLAEQVSVGLAVHQHKARALGESVDEQAQNRGCLAGAGRAGNGDVLPGILGGCPELMARDAPSDEERPVCRLGLAAAWRRVALVGQAAERGRRIGSLTRRLRTHSA
jgi:hypothetical protein